MQEPQNDPRLYILRRYVPPIEQLWYGEPMKRILAAVILSIIQPGLGQVLNRQVGKGIVVLLLSPLLIMGAVLTGLLHTAIGLAVFLVLGITIFLWALVDAVYVARKHRGQTPGKFNPWTLTLALLLALTNAIAGSTGFYMNRVLHVGAYVIASDAMDPTLRVGDRIIVDTAAYSKEPPRRGDVVVFVRSGFGETMFPKRVIAVGQDAVEGADRVKVNGVTPGEPYLAPYNPSMDATAPFGPLIVPANKFFVTGDNRQDSLDSREYGSLERGQFRGKILYLYWSRDRSRIGKAIQ